MEIRTDNGSEEYVKQKRDQRAEHIPKGNQYDFDSATILNKTSILTIILERH